MWATSLDVGRGNRVAVAAVAAVVAAAVEREHLHVKRKPRRALSLLSPSVSVAGGRRSESLLARHCR
ncbi:unnamed protein product [Lampetra fluviatilis]